jgi:hypothetical protein
VKWWRAGSVPTLFLSLSLAMHLGLLAGFSVDGASSAGGEVLHSASRTLQIVAVSLNEAPDHNLQRGNAKNANGQRDMVGLGREGHVSDSGSGSRNKRGTVRQIAETYFPANALTQKPLVAVDVSPDLMVIVPGVPPQAAVLRLLINEYGDVDSVVVENSLLPDVAQKKVTEAFSQLRFHPGEIRGVQVKSQLRIEVLLKDPQVTGNEKGR